VRVFGYKEEELRGIILGRGEGTQHVLLSRCLDKNIDLFKDCVNLK
jgi:hypothetical protein